MTTPVWSHFGLKCVDFEESSYDQLHILPVARKPEPRLQISACKTNSSPTELFLPNHS